MTKAEYKAREKLKREAKNKQKEEEKAMNIRLSDNVQNDRPFDLNDMGGCVWMTMLMHSVSRQGKNNDRARIRRSKT